MKTVRINGKIERETEKAIYMAIQFEYDCNMRTYNAWIPKSQYNTESQEIPVWLSDKIGDQIRTSGMFRDMARNLGGRNLLY